MTYSAPVTILLVDDQPSKLLSYEVILEGLGERLIKAQAGREALQVLLKTEVAVVLVDVCMPDLDGFELAELIRDHPRFRETAIIFVSAVQLSDADRVRGYRLGAVDYVSVPVIPEVLQAKVKLFCELYRKARQLEQLNRELEHRVTERTTELAAVAGRLNLAMEVARLGTWDWDMDTGRIIWSDGQYALHGYRVGDIEPSYQAWASRVHPDDLPAIENAIVEARDNLVPYHQIYRAVHPDGQITWCEARAQFECAKAGSRPLRMLGVTMDVTEHIAAQERQRLMLSELHHRVKNSLATVQAVAGLSARHATTIDEFCKSFTRRLVAMSRTHTLLVSSNWQRIELQQLLLNEIGSFDDRGNRLSFSGPHVSLPSEVALSLGLAIHELTTNAAKHGALSVPDGRLDVSWSIDQSSDAPSLEIFWRESGGPRVSPPARKGFGSILLYRLFAAIPGAAVETRYLPAGAEIDLALPSGDWWVVDAPPPSHEGGGSRVKPMAAPAALATTPQTSAT